MKSVVDELFEPSRHPPAGKATLGDWIAFIEGVRYGLRNAPLATVERGLSNVRDTLLRDGHSMTALQLCVHKAMEALYAQRLHEIIAERERAAAERCECRVNEYYRTARQLLASAAQEMTSRIDAHGTVDTDTGKVR